jgi:N-methylhydantoinase A/oxoprolinase/acetone carboxylase beta subunit
MRYHGQRKELTVQIPNGTLTKSGSRLLRAAFERAYARVYHRRHTGHPVEALAWRLAATGPAIQRPAKAGSAIRAARAVKPRHRRPMLFAGLPERTVCPVFSRYELTAGMVVKGPAVIEEPESTTVIGPRGSAAVDGFGNLILELPR